MPPRWSELLHHRWLAPAAGLLAVGLTLPALLTGRYGDDWFHLAVLRHVGLAADRDPVAGLFVFMDGGRGSAALADAGLLSWWAPEGLRMAFFRPVTALTHVADEALFPGAWGVAHLHSLAWGGLLVTLVAGLFRRVGGASVATGLAAVLYAVQDHHVTAFTWLANRNALVAGALGLAVVVAHVTARTNGRTWAPLALLLTPPALLAGEAALAALAYLVAWELVLAPGAPPARARALLPYAALLVLWRVGYASAGYGAWGSGLYIDPGAAPLHFLGALLERAPVLLAGAWLHAPIDAWGLAPPALRLGIDAAAWVGVALVAAVLLPTARRSPEARAWLLGSALATVPMCATFPMDRLLLLPGIGVAGALGVALAELPDAGWRRRALLLAAALHLAVSAPLLLARTATLAAWGDVFEGGERAAPADAGMADRTLLFLNGTDFAPVYAATTRVARGAPTAPARVGVLVPQTTAATFTRVDDSTLRADVPDGLFGVPIEGLMRDPGLPFRPGDTVARADFTATVDSVTADGRPTTITFRFRRPLSDPGYCWMAFTPEGPVRLLDPAADGPLVLPSVLPLPVPVRREDVPVR